MAVSSIGAPPNTVNQVRERLAALAAAAATRELMPEQRRQADDLDRREQERREQLEFDFGASYDERMPRSVYCSNYDKASQPVLRAKATALRKRHIQANPPWLVCHLVFDYDRDGAWGAHDEAGLPAPTWTAINPSNGHGHLGYSIKRPVMVEHYNGSRQAARYAIDVQRAMTRRLGADVAYSGFMTKNPLHRCWAVLQNGRQYSLGDLGAWLGDDLPLVRHRRLSEPAIGIGRNFDTFDTVRQWAYSAIREQWEVGDESAWEQACVGAAIEHTTGRHEPPLHAAECGWIGRSIARWTWTRFTRAQFSRVQSARRRGGKAVRERRSERDRQIMALVETGETHAAVAAALGVSTKTVQRAVRAEVDKTISG